MFWTLYHRARILFVVITNRMRQLLISTTRRLGWQSAPESVLDLTNRLVETAARNCGVTVKRLDSKFLSLSKAGKTYFSTSTNFSFESLTAYWICGDKYLSAQLLSEAGLPVPLCSKYAAADPVAAFESFAKLPTPNVVKPNRGSGGNGVTVNIDNLPDFRRAFYNAAAYCSEIIVEQFVEGPNWRCNVLHDELITAWKRLPAQVNGDGHSSIGDLIRAYNANLGTTEGFPVGMPIVVDKSATQNLAKQGFSLATILDINQVAYVHFICNYSVGGRTQDITETVHPDFHQMSIQAAKSLGAKFVGIDMIADDITSPYTPGSAFILEVNTTPGLHVKHINENLSVLNDAEKIIQRLF